MGRREEAGGKPNRTRDGEMEEWQEGSLVPKMEGGQVQGQGQFQGQGWGERRHQMQRTRRGNLSLSPLQTRGDLQGAAEDRK